MAAAISLLLNFKMFSLLEDTLYIPVFSSCIGRLFILQYLNIYKKSLRKRNIHNIIFGITPESHKINLLLNVKEFTVFSFQEIVSTMFVHIEHKAVTHIVGPSLANFGKPVGNGRYRDFSNWSISEPLTAGSLLVLCCK